MKRLSTPVPYVRRDRRVLMTVWSSPKHTAPERNRQERHGRQWTTLFERIRIPRGHFQEVGDFSNANLFFKKEPKSLLPDMIYGRKMYQTCVCSKCTKHAHSAPPDLLARFGVLFVAGRGQEGQGREERRWHSAPRGLTW